MWMEIVGWDEKLKSLKLQAALSPLGSDIFLSTTSKFTQRHVISHDNKDSLFI